MSASISSVGIHAAEALEEGLRAVPRGGGKVLNEDYPIIRRTRPTRGRGDSNGAMSRGCDPRRARTRLYAQRANSGVAGQRPPRGPERDFDGDQQRPDALEGLFRSPECQDTDRLSATADAPANRGRYF